MACAGGDDVAPRQKLGEAGPRPFRPERHDGEIRLPPSKARIISGAFPWVPTTLTSGSRVWNPATKGEILASMKNGTPPTRTCPSVPFRYPVTALDALREA